MNNKIHTVTKISLFMENYERELRIGGDIRKKEKVEKTMKFMERMKKLQEEARVALKKAQEDMKRQTNNRRKEIEDWKK